MRWIWIILLAALGCNQELPVSSSLPSAKVVDAFVPDPDLVAEVETKADGHSNPDAAKRLRRIAKGMKGESGGYTSQECYDTASHYGVSNVWGPWCDEIARREAHEANSQQQCASDEHEHDGIGCHSVDDPHDPPEPQQSDPPEPQQSEPPVKLKPKSGCPDFDYTVKTFQWRSTTQDAYESKSTGVNHGDEWICLSQPADKDFIIQFSYSDHNDQQDVDCKNNPEYYRTRIGVDYRSLRNGVIVKKGDVAIEAFWAAVIKDNNIAHFPASYKITLGALGEGWSAGANKTLTITIINDDYVRVYFRGPRFYGDPHILVNRDLGFCIDIEFKVNGGDPHTITIPSGTQMYEKVSLGEFMDYHDDVEIIGVSPSGGWKDNRQWRIDYNLTAYGARKGY